MEFGVCLPSAGAKATVENIVTVAGWAEALGFHSLWVTDHVVLPLQVDSWYPYRSHGRWDYAPNTNWLDPLLTLSWAGQAAPHCKLGTTILVAPLRNPILLAKQAATLDYLTCGRLILGLGAGWMAEEFGLVGTTYEDRGRRAVEMAQLMRAFWSGETVQFDGQYWHVHDCQMYPRPANGTIPIYWGGHSEASMRKVAQVGDGWHPTQIPLAELQAGVKRMREICEQYGRDPESVPIIARPYDKYPVSPETLEAHQAMGVTHWIIDPIIKDPSLEVLHEEMQRVAELVGLEPRGQRPAAETAATP
ncbi:MAG: TIGR03619 family F420-dependent LLM class oxidoreductase [Anaerolineae bacterium]